MRLSKSFPCAVYKGRSRRSSKEPKRDDGALGQGSGRGKEEKCKCLVYVVEEGPTGLAEGSYMGHKENSSWKFLGFGLGRS